MDRNDDCLGHARACTGQSINYVSRTHEAPRAFAFAQEVCDSNYGTTLGDSMICAGFPEGGRDACQGDSAQPPLQRTALARSMRTGLL